MPRECACVTQGSFTKLLYDRYIYICKAWACRKTWREHVYLALVVLIHYARRQVDWRQEPCASLRCLLHFRLEAPEVQRCCPGLWCASNWCYGSSILAHWRNNQAHHFVLLGVPCVLQFFNRFPILLCKSFPCQDCLEWALSTGDILLRLDLIFA